MAIAAESFRQANTREDYRVWFLEVDSINHVVGIGVKSRQELVESLFKSYKDSGKSNWRAFRKGEGHSTPIDLIDFTSKNIYENTHFGNLPTLAEFQHTLAKLQMNLELQPIAQAS
jgi:hypothetical protein